MKYLLYSIISGVLLGLSGIIIKILLESKELFMIILEPLFLVAGILGTIAFLLSQIALKNTKSSLVTLMVTITTTIVSIIGGNILGEVINSYEIVGIFLMTCSVIIIILRQ
jgi:drug/metabolite transporter (DMT)-like permease